MEFKIAHTNINVSDLDKSVKFYQEALGMKEIKRIEPAHGRFRIVFMADGLNSEHQLELTWLADKTTPYDLGDNESHIAFVVKDFDEAYALHKSMGVICFENKDMGLYFINDPDDYWMEIVPVR